MCAAGLSHCVQFARSECTDQYKINQNTSRLPSLPPSPLPPSSPLKRSRDEEEEEGRETESRRVSFERSLTTKATAVLQQMRELLRTKAQCGEKNFICGGEVEVRI